MMKRMMIALLALCLLLCGCAAEEEVPAAPVPTDFTTAGLHLTLTDDFSEKQHVGYTGYYESENMLVLLLKEEYTLFENTDFSHRTAPEQYAALVWSSNKLEGQVPLQEDENLLWFEFDRTTNGADYRYRAYVFKSDDAFWLVQFSTYADSFDAMTDTMHEYAASVYFDRPYLSTLPEIAY